VSHPSLDFNRWDGPRSGVMARRWAITSMGLRQLLQGKFFKALLGLGIMAGLVVAVAGFVFSQTLAEDGWLATLAAKGGPRMEAVMQAVSAMLLLYPDLLVTGAYKVVFWAQAQLGLLLSLVAMTLLVPQLITRDRGSQALTIYLARPLTSRDYLLGKFGIIIGVLLMLWTLPLVVGWIVSMALVPDMVFFNYSLEAMGAALLFNMVAMVVVGSVAFGVSALAKTAASARLWWIGLWIVMGIVAKTGALPSWVGHASFSYDLKLLSDEIFALGDTLAEAAEILPMLSTNLAREVGQFGEGKGTNELTGVITGLVILVGASLTFLWGRIKPE
jgi:ABC-2 type transport system permease protein